MKERQRWTTEEDALLSAYVKQYGPREWHLVSRRMNTPLDRDAKSCLERGSHNVDNSALTLGCLPSCPGAHPEPMIMLELKDCCRELDEGHRALEAHKKEAAWRLNKLELQLESEKASQKREMMEEIEVKINALKDEQEASIERIEAQYREQLAGLRRDAEAKEQKLAEQWATK
uniref:Uncharacterized protein n=1 Tax=Chenopodium quinoa TaxID=63459 RepID=A0A803N6J9_CHEQI